jgi:hypothetical protein
MLIFAMVLASVVLLLVIVQAIGYKSSKKVKQEKEY